MQIFWLVLLVLAVLADPDACSEEDEAASMDVRLLQVNLKVRRSQVQDSHGLLERAIKADKNLSFAHVPCNFGHSVGKVALGQPVNISYVKKAWHESPNPVLMAENANMSVTKAAWRAWAESSNMTDAITFMKEAGQPWGQLWGMMHPPSWVISDKTNCNMYYTPGKYWPEDLAQKYFGDRAVFGILRDPYDKMVNEFRRQVQGIDSGFNFQSRHMIDVRENNTERLSSRYEQYYKTCDVNGYLKEELQKYKAGDHFRSNCALLPQAEYFDEPFGITLPIDNRKIPAAFNIDMSEHSYSFRMNLTIHNWECTNLSAWSLDSETKALIKEVYARDFELLCHYFGYCDRDELTCLEQIPDMCGGRP